MGTVTVQLTFNFISITNGIGKWVNLGPGCTGQIFVYFAKKSVINSLRQVRPVIFRSIKFCQGLPNFKDAVVLPRSRTNFCQAWNLSDLSIYTPWFEGTCQSRKFDLYFWSEYFSPKPAKIKFIFARQPNDKHGWFVPWYAPGGSVHAI